MIKAVFFDLSDTLCDYQSAARVALDAAGQYAAGHSPALSPTGMRDAYLREARRAEEEGRRWSASRLGAGGPEPDYRLWERALEKCGVSNQILARAVACHYEQSRMQTLRPMPDALAALQALQGRVRVGVIAEGSGALVNEELARLDLRRLLSIVVIEQEAGFAKRDPRLFALATREAGCEPEEAAHVGDSLETDIAPAEKAGLVTVWVNRGEETVRHEVAIPDLIVGSLEPVPDLLLAQP